MANMASVAYAIEGKKESLEKIFNAIFLAMDEKSTFYKEYLACKNLNLTDEQLKGKRLGGDFSDYPYFDEGSGALRFSAEERWGLQDFVDCLEMTFPDIKIYWSVEECGQEIYCTNDKEGKYFSDRYWVDTAQDDIYQSEYFKTEEAMYRWLNEKYGVSSEEEVEAWNANYEDTGDDCENFIYIHKIEVID